jgi:hypothetical protein
MDSLQAGDVNGVQKGYSIFHFCPGNSPNRDELFHRNRTYMTMAAGAASGRRKTFVHQNNIVWTLFDSVSTIFIHL